MKNKHHRLWEAFFTRKLLLAACIISPFVFFGVAAVLADVWTGPANRTAAGSCTIHHYHQGALVCSEPCGEPEYNICTAACANAGGCDSSTTVNNPGKSLPDATVSGTTSCSSPGDNGWCKGTATLYLSGSEPVSGYSITGFDSDLYGPLCSGASCDWNFPQGVTTNLGYWADSSFGDQSAEAHVSVSVDSVAPTLTLTVPAPNGSNGWNRSGPITANASATDASSGVASVDINGSGSSFTASSDGVYNLTATATDKAGNAATTSGTIRLDTTPPGLSVSPAAPDGANNWYVSPAVLDATDSDAISGIASTQYQVDGGAWQNGSSFSEGVDGTHTIVFRAADVAGNTTTAPVTVTVDRTLPIADASLNPVSPNGSDGWYTAPVTVTANSSDATSGIASQGVSLDGSTWARALTLSNDGVYTVQVSAKDNAGNMASTTRTVQLDTTPPTASFQVPAADGTNGWYVSPVTVTVSGTDATSGVASHEVSLDGSSWTSSLTLSTDGIYSVHGRVTDNAGNTTTLSPMTVMVDRTSPIQDVTLSPASPNGANGWYTSPVTAMANCSDVLSGLASQGVSLDGSTWTPSLTISSDGTSVVQVSAKNNAGNMASTTRTVQLDTTPPTASFQQPAPDGANGWHVSPVTVTVIGMDATSGVESQVVSLDGSTWTPSLTLSADGIYTVHGRVVDNAGNTTVITQIVSIDRTSPLVSAPILTGSLGQSGWYTSSVGVSASATDVTSGVALVQYSVDGGALQTTTPTLTDGVHTVQVKVTDKAGNVSSTSASASVDATPSVSAFISPTEGSSVNVSGNQKVHMTGSTTDATSGVAGAEISLDGGATWQNLLLGGGDTWSYDWNSLRNNGTYTFLVRAADNAGNLEHGARVTIVVGNQAPSVYLTPLWLDIGSARVNIHGGSLPVAGASITVKDPKGRWPEAVFSYSGSALPTKFVWLGRMGDGSIATIGKYQVIVKAWDAFGNTSAASGWVVIPLPPPQPTAIPAAPIKGPVVVQPTPTPTVQPLAVVSAPLKGNPQVIVAKPVLVKKMAKKIQPSTIQIILWPAFAFIGLLAVLASASLSDRRPRELKALARSLDVTREIQKSYLLEDI